MPNIVIVVLVAIFLGMLVILVLAPTLISSGGSVGSYSQLSTQFNAKCSLWQQVKCDPTSPLVTEIMVLYKKMNNDDRAYIPIEELQRACNCYVSTSPTSGGYVAREFKDVPREESERKESSDTGTGVMVLIPPRAPSEGE
jgi:hypothetical protein